MDESKQAKLMLAQKENGLTYSTFFNRLKSRLFLRLLLIGILLFFYFKHGGLFPLFGVGFILGMTIQDLSWVKPIVKSWPFTKSIIDWQKVENIANSKID